MKCTSVLSLALLFLTPKPTFAWHEPAHTITALVAYEQLDTDTRKRIVDILKHYPRLSDLTTTNIPQGLSDEDQQRWFFCLASIWPDLVRPPHGDGNIPPDPNHKTSYHREQWHFINFPFPLLPAGATDAQRAALESAAKTNLNLATTPPGQEILRMNVIQAIDFNAALLKDSTNSPTNGAVAICWIMHTVGDIHQPLRATALFTQNIFQPDPANPEGDRGGNLIKFGSSNLHSLWDDAPGTNRTRFTAQTFTNVVARTKALLQNNDLKTKGEAAAQNTNLQDWANESFGFAKTNAYTEPIQNQILTADSQGVDPQHHLILTALPAGYSDAASVLSDQRVVEGGYRLAAKLRASCPQ
jgi:hypothetical protein